MTEIQLAGSGGWVNAELTDEQVTKSKLVPNMDKHFLASLEKLDTTKMIKHFKKKNIKTFNGLDMFIYQGQKSFYIWNKINPEIDENLINLLKKNIK